MIVFAEKAMEVLILNNIKLMQRIIDLAAFYNVSPYAIFPLIAHGDVIRLRKNFGISIVYSELHEKASKIKITEGMKRITTSHQVQAFFDLILEKTSQAEGEYLRIISESEAR